MSQVDSVQVPTVQKATPRVRLSRPRLDSVLVRSTYSVSELPAVKLFEPAMLVLTDFREEPPITVSEDRPIDEALRDMIRFGRERRWETCGRCWRASRRLTSSGRDPGSVYIRLRAHLEGADRASDRRKRQIGG